MVSLSLLVHDMAQLNLFSSSPGHVSESELHGAELGQHPERIPAAFSANIHVRWRAAGVQGEGTNQCHAKTMRRRVIDCSPHSEMRELGHDLPALHPGPGVHDLSRLLQNHGFEPDVTYQQTR